jgi:hypothetical protein
MKGATIFLFTWKYILKYAIILDEKKISELSAVLNTAGNRLSTEDLRTSCVAGLRRYAY